MCTIVFIETKAGFKSDSSFACVLFFLLNPLLYNVYLGVILVYVLVLSPIMGRCNAAALQSSPVIRIRLFSQILIWIWIRIN